MSKLLQLAILTGITATTVSAVDITFKRYSQAGCNAETNHIAADTHLHDPYCKSFDEDEPAFFSFIVQPTDDQEDMYEKYCYVTVFDREDCMGQGYAYGNMTTYKNVCTGTPIPGRSVRVSCQDATTYTGSFPATTITATHETVIVDDPTPTFITVDPTTFVVTTQEAVSVSTSKPKKHHKHGKGNKNGKENIDVAFSDLSSTTMVAVSETTYFQSFPTTPTTAMSTITLVPASQKTETAQKDDKHDGHATTMDETCDEHPDLDVCNSIQDKTE